MAPKQTNFQHILVYGLGGVGGYFGGLLADALNKGPAGGPQVHFIARGAHLKAIQEKGLILKTGDGEIRRCLPNTASDDPTPLPMVDLVLLCVKGYDLAGALETIKEKVTPSTVIIPLMNGVDNHEKISAFFEHAVVLPACVYISSHISAPGEITQIGPAGRIVTGNRFGRRDLYPESLLMLALKAGWQLEWVEVPEREMWKKYLFVAPFALVTASRDITFGEALADPEARAELEGMMDEIASLAEAAGFPLDADAAERSLALAATFPPETRSSFQLDVKAGKEQNEKDVFAGFPVKMGLEKGLSVDMVNKLVRRLEKTGKEG